MSAARRTKYAKDMWRGVELRCVGSKPADCKSNIHNGVGIVVLITLAIIDGNNYDAHRGEGVVHEHMFIATFILPHPGSTMNIEDGWERTWARGLVDGRLEGLTVYL